MNIEHWIKKELENSAEDKKYCIKHYPDYVDDEYNCNELKFIFGVKSDEDKSDSETSFCTLNDFVIYYNRKTEKYYADIDFPYGRKLKKYVESVQKVLTSLGNFMDENNIKFDTKRVLENATLITTQADNLEDLCNCANVILLGLYWRVLGEEL